MFIKVTFEDGEKALFNTDIIHRISAQETGCLLCYIAPKGRGYSAVLRESLEEIESQLVASQKKTPL